MTDQDAPLFPTTADIGAPALAGETLSRRRDTLITASGANIWGWHDSFRFAWREVSGDFSLDALVEFVGRGSDPHRKAVIMARASLEPDAACVHIDLHGDGLVSLQFRSATGAETAEYRAWRTGGERLRLSRTGSFFTGWIEGVPAAGSVRLELPDTLLVGIGVCSHDDEVRETAAFSELRMSRSPARDRLFSVVETLEPATGTRTALRVVDRWVEAPNWTADDRLILNGGGILHAMPADGGVLQRIDTGDAEECNNDHGISPDSSTLVISDSSDGPGGSRVRVLPISGGQPRTVTALAPSYWHGWSPDGRRLAYTAERDGVWGVFDIDANGGEERRLSTAAGLDDGPEYSPDGRWIYLNSDRTGRMQISRIPAEGGEPETVIASDTADWFPHFSPDGRVVAYLAYAPDVDGHPRDQDVALRLLDTADGSTRELTRLFGGQGTMNVPSWSPDGSRFAFVSYVYG